MAQRFSRPTDFVRKRKRDPTVSIVPGTFTDILTRELFLNSFYQRPIGTSKTEPLVAQYDGPAPVLTGMRGPSSSVICLLTREIRRSAMSRPPPALCNGLRMKRLHVRGAASREISSIKDY